MTGVPLVRKRAPEVSVVVASHCRPGPIARVLESIQVQQQELAVEVIVVDNPSARSDEIAAVVAGFPGAQLIRLRSNIGFGRAINRGVAVATAPLVYFACDDVVLGAGCLASLRAAHLARPAAGLTAPVIYAADQPARVVFAGGTHEIALTPRLTFWTEVPPSPERCPYPVTFIPGGAALVDRALFLRLGGYREDFFMYEEDTELCQRVRGAGRDLFVAAAASSFDLGPPPTFDPDRINAIKARNYLAVLLLHSPPHLIVPILAKQFATCVRRLLMGPRAVGRSWTVGWWRFLLAAPGLLRDRRRLVRLGRG